MAKRRIMKELDEINKNPIEGITVNTIGGDFQHWEAHIHGPSGSEYEGGVFVLDIQFQSGYPLKPPKCHFTTKIYHPNIGQNGEICLGKLKKEWSPAESIKNILNDIYFLIQTPDPDDAISAEVAAHYKNDLKAFKETAVDWTKKYATSQ